MQSKWSNSRKTRVFINRPLFLAFDNFGQSTTLASVISPAPSPKIYVSSIAALHLRWLAFVEICRTSIFISPKCDCMENVFPSLPNILSLRFEKLCNSAPNKVDADLTFSTILCLDQTSKQWAHKRSISSIIHNTDLSSP